MLLRLLGVLLLLPAPAHATVRYVNGSCSTNGDGTAQDCAEAAGARGAHPTIAAGIAAAQPGDTIQIRPTGSAYRESQITTPIAGSADAPIVITRTDTSVTRPLWGPPATPSGERLSVRHAWWVFDNLIFDNDGLDRDVITVDAPQVTIQSCWIRDGINDGISVSQNGDGLTVAYCTIDSVGSNGDTHGLTTGREGEPSSGYTLTGLRIVGNTFREIGGDAIQIYEAGDSCRVVFVTGLIDSNTFQKGSRPGHENAIDIKSAAFAADPLIISNNTITGWDGDSTAAGNRAVVIQHCADHTKFRGNFIDAEGPGADNPDDVWAPIDSSLAVGVHYSASTVRITIGPDSLGQVLSRPPVVGGEISDNVFFNCHYAAIEIGDGPGDTNDGLVISGNKSYDHRGPMFRFRGPVVNGLIQNNESWPDMVALYKKDSNPPEYVVGGRGVRCHTGASFSGVASQNGWFGTTEQQNSCNAPCANLCFSGSLYTVLAMAGAGGAISPVGAVSVTHGSDQGFTITAGVGYHVAEVRVDGVSVGALASYTISNVTASHTVDASFAINTYTLGVAVVGTGTVAKSPEQASYEHGTVVALSAAAGAGYTFTGWSGDTSGVANPLSVTMEGNKSVTATFTLNTYVLTATAGAGGAISPVGAVSVTHGSDQGFTITAGVGYHVAEVRVDGVSVGALASYTISNVTASHTVDASFAMTVERRIVAGTDDAEESASGGMNLNSSDIELVFDGSNQKDGLRFTNLTIPPGATVMRAYLQFEVDEVQSEFTNLTFQGEAADHAAPFTATALNLSSRPRTAAAVSWSPVAWSLVAEAGPNQRSPDLSAVIQEIVSRPGWASGNALAILITGTGHRTARAYEGRALGAALLHVEVGSGGSPPTNAAPTVDGGPAQTLTLPAEALLDGTVSDDGLPNPPGALTAGWSAGSGPGPVSFQDPSAVDTRATFTTAGSYVLRLSVSDGELSATDSVQITVQAPPPPGAMTVERRIVAGTDDAEESASGGMNLNSSDIELVFDGSNQKDGLRFTNLTIPPGATVMRAYLQFEVDEVQSEFTNLTFQGEAADHAAPFTATALNLSSRPRTAAAVSWSPVAWSLVAEAGPNQRSPDLSAVIQEIVSRPGWASGNALAILITGTGHRTARAYEGRALGAALLHVEVGSGGSPPTKAAPTAGGDGPRLDFALHGVSPIPARGALRVEFSLTDGQPATLELLDVTGRRLSSREVGGLGPGRHRLELRDDLPAGVYLVRLTQSSRVGTTKAVWLK